MKNISFIILFLFSSIHLMAQESSKSESIDKNTNGALEFKTEVPKGLNYKNSNGYFDKYELPKTLNYKAIPLIPEDSNMKIYIPDCNCAISNYEPKNPENSYLRVYNSK